VNIAVCIKQVPDTETKIKIASDNKSINEDGIKWIVNPYDEFAIEEALKLVEKLGGEVTIISVGPANIEKSIREALAMGAHHAIRIDAPRIPYDPVVTSSALASVLKESNYDLIFLGQRAIDADHCQVASMLSQILELPCVPLVVKLDIDGNKVTALREIEGGDEKISFDLPAIVSAQRGLNQPRYRSLKGIMQAKKKEIQVKQTSLPEEKLNLRKLTYPPEKAPGRIVGHGAEAVPELVSLLREEAKVL
jgi:electron transfer flavoprotein beta subunit